MTVLELAGFAGLILSSALLGPELVHVGIGLSATVVILAGVGLVLVVSLGIDRRSRQERAAGYTTLFHRYPEYWQLDDRTGSVIRRPGEETS